MSNDRPHLVRIEAFVQEAMIVLRCTCGYVRALGQTPDAQAVVDALDDHLRRREHG